MNCINIIDISTIKDIVLIIGSLTATVYTLYSYKKSRKELSIKFRHELSRNLFKSIYDLKQVFNYTRSSLILASEYPANFKIDETKQSEKLRSVFENRFRHLNEKVNTILSLIGEAELEYKNEIPQLCNEILNQIYNYKEDVSLFIQLVDNTNHRDPDLVNLRKVIYNIDPTSNKTTIKFEKKIEEILSMLKKELSRN